jgi:hypothetical protein
MAATIVIACPTCMQKLRVPQSLIGREINCPQCKNAFTVTDPNALTSDVPTISGQQAPSAQDPTIWSSLPPSARPEARGGSFVDYLLFRRMVTPVIMTLVFYAGAMLILLTGFVYAGMMIVVAVRASVLSGLLMVAASFFGTIFSLVMWRIYCEVLIALFRILDNVREINEQLKSKGDS